MQDVALANIKSSQKSGYYQYCDVLTAVDRIRAEKCHG